MIRTAKLLLKHHIYNLNEFISSMTLKRSVKMGFESFIFNVEDFTTFIIKELTLSLYVNGWKSEDDLDQRWAKKIMIQKIFSSHFFSRKKSEKKEKTK